MVIIKLNHRPLFALPKNIDVMPNPT